MAQTDTHTDGHCDSMTEATQKANSVKIIFCICPEYIHNHDCLENLGGVDLLYQTLSLLPPTLC